MIQERYSREHVRRRQGYEKDGYDFIESAFVTAPPAFSARKNGRRRAICTYGSYAPRPVDRICKLVWKSSPADETERLTGTNGKTTTTN
jgi:UDP-N-acetylmuramoylalanine-D-glutamate ligase